MTDLFDIKAEEDKNKTAPLADRVRPETFEEFFGQDHIVGSGKVLRQAIESDELPSIIFWGPPGSGKTTLARIIANLTDADFVAFHAVTEGVPALRKVIQVAGERLKLYGKKTILFIDEIHRWSKSQQDALLPHVENGTITLIGATTENPSFEVVGALMSRCQVFTLNKLKPEHIREIIEVALKDKKKGLGEESLRVGAGPLDWLSQMADGDARVALNAIELATKASQRRKSDEITKEDISEALQSSLRYDKHGEEHYNIISALHKSLRGSDENASLYWLGRMLEAGEDPLFVARRLVRFASEDVGVADSHALTVAVAGYEATHFIGMPECNVILAEVVVYLARAKKSNALYEAYGRVQKDIREYGMLPVPLHLRNAPTKFMKDLDYSKGYQYNPEYKKKGKKTTQKYLPPELEKRNYFKD